MDHIADEMEETPSGYLIHRVHNHGRNEKKQEHCSYTLAVLGITKGSLNST